MLIRVVVFILVLQHSRMIDTSYRALFHHNKRNNTNNCDNNDLSLFGMLLVLVESEDIIPPDPTFTYIRESLTKKIKIKQNMRS